MLTAFGPIATRLHMGISGTVRRNAPIQRGSAPHAKTRSALDTLTDRELEVMREVARGLTNREIAGRLYIGDGTVKTHVARILAKLGLRDRVQVVVYAYEHGITHPGGSDPPPPQ